MPIAMSMTQCHHTLGREQVHVIGVMHASKRNGLLTIRGVPVVGTMSTEPTSPADRHHEDHAPNTFLNAAIGAAITVVLFFVPFSPLLGGGIAGYLEGGETRTGVKVGAIAGVLAAIPIALLIFLAGAFFVIAPPLPFVWVFVSFLVVLVFIMAYTVGLSALGGILGVYVKEEV